MKKTLISLALFSMSGLGGFKAMAADDLIYGYSGDLSSNISTQSTNTKLGGAMYIPSAVAEQWSQAKLTGMKIGFGYGNARTVTVFITEKLGGTPVYTQEANMNASVWNEVTFTNPVNVPANGFYVGYEITTKSASDFPLAVDNIKTPVNNAGYIGINGQWSNYASQYGSLCLKVLVEGENLPANDITTLGYPVLSPYVGRNADFPVVASIINNGTKPVDSVTASCLINGVDLDADINCLLSPASIAPGEFGTVTINGILIGEIDNDVKIDVTFDTVNGTQDANPSNNLLSGTTNVISEAFPRNFVVEEWTGTWCGNCPVGIVGMSYMQEKYGNDRFIGIAVHGGQANEPMLTSSYNGFLSAFSNGGYPGCIINRNRDLVVYPAPETLEYYYLETQGEQTFANVEITDIDVSRAAEGKISVTSNTSFSISKSNAKYRMAYVLIEDNVGPYLQSNYFAGGQMGPLDGWENKGSKVEWYFNEVARYINSSLGINNSLPTTIDDGGEYQYTAELPVTNVDDLGNCYIVALLLNSSSGLVENAVKVKVPATTGVEGIVADNGVKVKGGKGELRILGDYKKIMVYSLSGKTVASSENADRLSLDKGIYIYSITLTDGSTENGRILIY